MSTITIGCYGKLPFHPEFINNYKPFPSLAAFTGWLDRIAPVLSAHPKFQVEHKVFVDFCLSPEPGADMVWGTWIPSSDGLRQYPFGLFSPVAQKHAECPHLIPLAARNMWLNCHNLLQADYTDLSEFLSTLSALEILEPDNHVLQKQEDKWLSLPVSSCQFLGPAQREVALRSFRNLKFLQASGSDLVPKFAVSINTFGMEAEHQAWFWMRLILKPYADVRPVGIFLVSTKEHSCLFVFFRIPNEADVQDMVVLNFQSRVINTLDADWNLNMEDVDLSPAFISVLYDGQSKMRDLIETW